MCCCLKQVNFNRFELAHIYQALSTEHDTQSFAFSTLNILPQNAITWTENDNEQRRKRQWEREGKKSIDLKCVYPFTSGEWTWISIKVPKYCLFTIKCYFVSLFFVLLFWLPSVCEFGAWCALFFVWFVYIHLLLVFRFIDVLFLYLLLPLFLSVDFQFFFFTIYSSVSCVMYRFMKHCTYRSMALLIFFYFIQYFSLLSIIISRNLVHDSLVPWIHRRLRLARLVCTVNWVLVLFYFLFFIVSFLSLYFVCSSFPFRFLFVNICSWSKFLNLSCHLFYLSIIFSTVRLFWYISNEMIRVSIWRWNFCCSLLNSVQCIFI